MATKYILDGVTAVARTGSDSTVRVELVGVQMQFPIVHRWETHFGVVLKNVLPAILQVCEAEAEKPMQHARIGCPTYQRKACHPNPP